MPIDVASLARHVAAEAEAGRFSGSVLVTDGTTPLLEVAHGHENRTTGTPITVQTRFGVASLCKAFTAVAIARLVERGVPRFDSPVMDVLPRALQPTHLSPRVTIHHLLCHTSGIGDYFDEDLLGAAAFEHVWDSVPCYRMRHVVDFLPLFAGLPPIAEPGAGFAYCGAGYVLLGLVLESLTSLAFAEAIEREVFQPAGMTESGYLAVDELHPHLAVGYIPPDGEHPVWRSNIFAIPPVGGPDGGAMCTARDVDRFLTALMDGRLLERTTQATLLQPHAQVDATGDAYAYGMWRVSSTPPERILLTGEDPGYSARAAIYVGTPARAVVLCNTSESSARMLRQINAVLAKSR